MGALGAPGASGAPMAGFGAKGAPGAAGAKGALGAAGDGDAMDTAVGLPPGGGSAPNGPGEEEVEIVGRLPGIGGEGLPGILGAPGADGAKGAPTGLPIPMDGARGALGVPQMEVLHHPMFFFKKIHG